MPSNLQGREIRFLLAASRIANQAFYLLSFRLGANSRKATRSLHWKCQFRSIL